MSTSISIIASRTRLELEFFDCAREIARDLRSRPFATVARQLNMSASQAKSFVAAGRLLADAPLRDLYLARNYPATFFTKIVGRTAKVTRATHGVDQLDLLRSLMSREYPSVDRAETGINAEITAILKRADASHNTHDTRLLHRHQNKDGSGVYVLRANPTLNMHIDQALRTATYERRNSNSQEDITVSLGRAFENLILKGGGARTGTIIHLLALPDLKKITRHTTILTSTGAILTIGQVAENIENFAELDLKTGVCDENGNLISLIKGRLANRTLSEISFITQGGCVVPGCPVPASRCEIDHQKEYRNGGETGRTNLRFLCPDHHAERHSKGGWDYEHDDLTGRTTIRYHDGHVETGWGLNHPRRPGSPRRRLAYFHRLLHGGG
ncbi:MAG: HNH endonuclease signature motif containing protein [Corynebacterium sp.]|nr:HNH endonuclease signature motif containing protein [Corynebacterium sp.]